MPYPGSHDLGHLGRGIDIDHVEMLAPRIVAADDGFLVSVARGDPQMAGGVLGKLPGPVVDTALGEDRAQAAAVQTDDPQGPRGQPGLTRRVGGHVVHAAQGLTLDVSRALHARPPVEPTDAGARKEDH